MSLDKKPPTSLRAALQAEADDEARRAWEEAAARRQRERAADDAAAEQARRALIAAVRQLDEARPGFTAKEQTVRAAEDGFQSALGARRVRAERTDAELRSLAPPTIGAMIAHIERATKGGNTELLDRLRELQLTPDADIASVLAEAASKYGRPPSDGR